MHIRSILPRLILTGAALGLLLPATEAAAGNWSWGGERVQGNGQVKSQKRAIGHFNGVSMALAGNVEVHTGAAEGISIETDDNLLPLIETVVEDGMLKIRPTKKNLNLETRTLKIVVNAKDLDTLALGGSGKLDADALKGGRVRVDLGGSGDITIKNVEASDLSVAVGGSGNVSISAGSADKIAVAIGGSGDLQAGGVKANDASVKIGGSGQATVWATNNLSLSVAGSGDVNYYGDPKVSKSVFGSGTAKRLGPAPR